MTQKQIKVELIDHMGTDLTCVNAARVSYGATSLEFAERDVALVKFLVANKHWSPFRHPQIQVRCHSPIFLARQVGKHQAGFSWNEISRRYKDNEAVPIEFYIPDIVMCRPEKLMTQQAVPMDMDFADDVKHIIHCANQSALRTYTHLIEYGVAPEQARMVLPQSMQTQWIWTGSLFGWANLYNQRSTEHAQYEANLFAEEVNKIMLELYPVCWKALTKQE